MHTLTLNLEANQAIMERLEKERKVKEGERRGEARGHYYDSSSSVLLPPLPLTPSVLPPHTHSEEH